MQQDVSYGLRQLADVALKALSPGINDPTTAQDAIFHAAAVLAEILRQDPEPVERTGDGGRCVVLSEQPTHADLVGLAYDEVRRAAATHPTVCLYLLESLHLVRQALDAAALGNKTGPLDGRGRACSSKPRKPPDSSPSISAASGTRVHETLRRVMHAGRPHLSSD